MLKDKGGGREVLKQRHSLTLLEKRAVIAYKDRHPGLRRDDLVDFCLLKFNRPISRASITNILQDADKLRHDVDRNLNSYNSGLKRIRRGNVEELERQLAEWAQDRKERGRPISDSLLLSKAKEVGSTIQDRIPATFNYSTTWLNKFKRKYGVNLRKLRQETKNHRKNFDARLSADTVSVRTRSTAVDLGGQRNELESFPLVQHESPDLPTMEESSQAAAFVPSLDMGASLPRPCADPSVGGAPAPVGAIPLTMANSLYQVTGLPADGDLSAPLAVFSNGRTPPKEKPLKKRSFLTLNQKREILLQREANPSVTRQVLVDYCRLQFGLTVSKATLTKLFQDKEEICRTVAEVGEDTANSLKKMRRSSIEILERPLATWYSKQAQNSLITDEMVLSKARHLGEHVKDKLPDGFNYSRSWLLAFKRRHGIDSKKSLGERNQTKDFKPWNAEDIKKFISEPTIQLDFGLQNTTDSQHQGSASTEKDEVKQAISKVLDFVDSHTYQLGKYRQALVALHSSVDNVMEPT